MGRSRVLSFMSTFGGPPKTSSASPSPSPVQPPQSKPLPHEPTFSSAVVSSPVSESPVTRTGRQRADSRPMSMIGGYQPPQMDTNDTVPELLPIFTFLNSHSNKLYQEGYFLKLNDLDSQGRPYPDRSWSECFAQLVGTVLSLWDAAALDAAGQDGEVPATFINLGDASIKMIETLETRSRDAQPLQNVLSISTAGKNRYLFHFSNIHALTQWTAGIRLAMFENTSLQEAYTGALIAGKGRALNNIKTIMTQSKFKSEEWTRVRFGAGTPWRRCWCVITPPDEKEVQKAQKSMKKRSAYDRTPVILKGDVKFYESRKVGKKTLPIATITDAYAAYAIYPQSKPLIEQSTLVKIEGSITIHSRPETQLESFIFVMPEVHPALTGFEMLLRFLFPIWDVFALYGRPTRLIPDTLDTRSLMFAMPKHERYGYLDILDVTTVVHSPGSSNWKEQQWRREMKQLTSSRIAKISRDQSQASSRATSRHGHSHRNSLPSRTAALRFQDNASMRSTPSLHRETEFKPRPIPHTDSAPPGAGPFPPPGTSYGHGRSVSESHPASPARRYRQGTDASERMPGRLSSEAPGPRESFDEEPGPPPPAHTVPVSLTHGGYAERARAASAESQQYRSSSESERRFHDAEDAEYGHDIPNKPPSPVAAPPAFSHEPGAKPQTRPYHSPELRRANSRMSSTTLSQLAAAGNAGGAAGTAAAAAWEGRRSEDQGYRGVNDDYYSRSGATADYSSGTKDMAVAGTGLSATNSSSTKTPTDPSSLRAPGKSFSRSVSPLSQVSTPTPQSPDQSNSQAQFISTPNYSHQQPDSAFTTPFTTPALYPSESPRPARPVSVGKISRKPVPSPSKVLPDPMSTVSPISDEYDRKQDVDDAILYRMNTVASKASTGSRRYSGESSRYDTDSVASPDYDSPEVSLTGRAQPPLPNKPRTGVLKTVGTVDPSKQEVVIGDAHYRPEQNQMPGGADIPNIDFGPTQLYKPEIRPANVRSKSSERLGGELANSSSDNLLLGRGRVSPGHVIDAYNRSPGRSALVTPEPDHSRAGSTNSAENRRSILWQPGAATRPESPSAAQLITPEQFVQQRAAANRVPVYAHVRHDSGNQARSHSRQDSRTPPLTSRHSSGDWSAQLAARQEAPRPGSRGAGTVMDSPLDYSRHLSAREQEHVARVTGSPLINMAGNAHQKTPSQGGLVGAIEAREQEKRAIKEGYGGYMVQQAIAQRQQQAQQAPYQGQHYPQPSPQMPMPGQFPITPQVDQLTWEQQQQQYINQRAYSTYGAQTGYTGQQTPQGYSQQTPQYPYQQGQHQGGHYQDQGYGYGR